MSPAPGAADLAPVVGRNLRRLRTERGLSLERLAQASGVSRALTSRDGVSKVGASSVGPTGMSLPTVAS